jgi:hypothetical protein
VIPNVTLLEAPWANHDGETDVCWPYPKIENGYALPLEGPGLGIGFNEELAASKPFVTSLQVPRLRGPVGWIGWVDMRSLNSEELWNTKEKQPDPKAASPLFSR